MAQFHDKNEFYEDIAQTLIQAKKLEAEKRLLSRKLRELCVECGLNQEAVLKISCSDFLDGYLVAHGQIQDYRRD